MVVVKVKDAVGIATGTVRVPERESESATTTGVATESVGRTVERGKVMLGTKDVGGTVLVAATDELERDSTESGIAGDPGTSGGKANAETRCDVRFPTIQSLARLYPSRIMSCPNSMGSSAEALPSQSVNQPSIWGPKQMSNLRHEDSASGFLNPVSKVITAFHGLTT